MVSLKTLGVAYAAANILGVNAGLCRPSTRTSLSASAPETTTSAPVVSTSASGSSIAISASTDKTSVTDETSAANTKTSGTTALSSSETVISSSNPSTSDISTIETSSSHTISLDLTTSSNPTTSSDAVTSVESTTSGVLTLSTGTSTSADSTTSGVPTTTAETSASTDATSTEATTSEGSTTAADTTTTANPTTTTADATTTSSEPTTTTSVCVEPTNLLRRPGFEDPDVGDVWGFYWGGGDVEHDPAEARTGDYIGVLPVPDGQERRMEQRIHITPGNEYTISFWYAVSNPPTVDTQCTIFAIFDYYTALKQVPLPSDSQYHQYTASFIAQDNLDPAIEIGVSCPSVGNGYTAYVYIDDTSAMDSNNECDATPVDPNAPPKSTLLVPAQPESPHCPVNLVQVPGFEADADNQAWAFYDIGEFVHDQSNARTGEWEALFPSETTDEGTYLEQNIDASSLVEGELYDYHFFWKPKTLPDSGTCYMFAGYNDLGFQQTTIDFGATSSTGYTLYSVRFAMPAGNLLLQIVFYCEYNDDNTVLGAVYVDDTALIKVGGCEAYPVTGALIENPSFEIQATDDSTYAWFGTNGMKIRAGSTADGPSPNSGDNFLYVQLGSTKKSATLTKPLASPLDAGTTYTLQFNWAAGSAYVPSTCSFKIVFGSVSQTLDLDAQATAYQYQLFENSFTAGDSADSMSITVECTDASGFPDFAFDDFSLQ
ncbi:hypothetical protein FCIRC_9261 [Fusarium circinatum]|uniref:CBM-cenC domain-containing protein n=1 Tax=Fusarium circinatum TaxID=48490 RepID=A0A8H5TH91_FUSCI|nr:hypothetical protein FCIRC_9261 [Fusarium circinatum]